ncbi:hypothetical protein J6590_083061 [Homalodisca vitripennis]|nr:hypothetical protein J6590_083061 [Homalodisca vitripennis]
MCWVKPSRQTRSPSPTYRLSFTYTLGYYRLNFLGEAIKAYTFPVPPTVSHSDLYTRQIQVIAIISEPIQLRVTLPDYILGEAIKAYTFPELHLPSLIQSYTQGNYRLNLLGEAIKAKTFPKPHLPSLIQLYTRQIQDSKASVSPRYLVVDRREMVAIHHLSFSPRTHQLFVPRFHSTIKRNRSYHTADATLAPSRVTTGLCITSGLSLTHTTCRGAGLPEDNGGTLDNDYHAQHGNH